MAEVRDPASEIEAAELAAGSGDFMSAEQHLSRAVELEELSFGPMHAELASVLNNLGVVYERLDRPEKAEACYRRAYGIAKASLPEGDPGIELSATNLREFCTAKGIPFEKPPAAPIAVPAANKKPERAASEALPEPEPEPALSPAPRTLAIAALAVIAVAGVIFLATRSSSPPNEPTPATTRAITPAAPVQEPVPVPAAGTPAPPAPTTQAPSPTKPAPLPAPPATRRAATAASAVVPTLVSAQVCRSLNTSGDWHCAAVDGTTQAGPVYFYTRLKSPADTAVEHRWYHGTRLQQKMTLRIHANQGTGYRTYSRRTVAAAGEWKVELRAADGTLLHEERFTVGASQD